MLDIIKLSVPLFFISMIIEIIYLRWIKKTEYYRINDTLNSISLGIVSQIADIFLKVILYVWGYNYVLEHFNIQKLGVPAIEPNAFTWIFAFLFLDFLYYWFHRMSHQVGLIWASHVVHHQSEEYNLSTALRQSSFQAIFSWFFYVQLAVLGFPFEMFFTCIGINLLYQFWIHTRAIKRLGFLELFMNTPSHHRVHHGKNPKYCDKNHAGVFIIWDRMFGTFQEEEEEPVFGITIPLNSWNPIWANWTSFKSLFSEVANAKGFDKIKILFMPPGWRPAYMGAPILPIEVDAKTYKKYDPKVPSLLTIYSFVHFVLLLLAATQILEFSEKFNQKTSWEQIQVLALSFFVLLSVANIGGLLENHKWAFYTEIARMIALIGVCVMMFLGTSFVIWTVIGAFVIASLSLYYLSKNAQKFQ